MSTHEPAALKHHFDDLAQQHEADTLGMWLFLATEILLFGGLFLGYAVYRALYPEAWAESSHHNNVLLGTINTAVLLVSSLTVALAVHASEEDEWKTTSTLLWVTVVLCLLFLGIKFYEYYEHFLHHKVPGVDFQLESGEQPQSALFFAFYFVMTGLHAFHMVIGISLVALMAVQAARRRLTHHMPVEITGLYWHLIDIIWVFLYPLLYLVG